MPCSPTVARLFPRTATGGCARKVLSDPLDHHHIGNTATSHPAVTGAPQVTTDANSRGILPA